MADPRRALELVTLISSIGVVISSLEILRFPRQLDDHGVMSWPISRLRHPRLSHGRTGMWLDVVLRVQVVWSLYALRAGAALWLIVARPQPAVVAALSIVIVLISILHYVRSPFGSDGADQMTTLTFSALALAGMVPTPPVQIAALWFIALQACLSYVTAGAAKALSAAWREQPVLTGIFATTAYGNRRVRAFLQQHPLVSRVAGQLGTAIEIAFPLALVLPPAIGWALIACGLAFHLLAAFLMGLNTFFWAFAAAYPAILYCGRYV